MLGELLGELKPNTAGAPVIRATCGCVMPDGYPALTPRNLVWPVGAEPAWLRVRSAQRVLATEFLHDGARTVEAVLFQPTQGLDKVTLGALLLGVLSQILWRAGVVESGQALLNTCLSAYPLGGSENLACGHTALVVRPVIE